MEIFSLEEQEKRRKQVYAKLKAGFSLPSPSNTVVEMIRLCNSEDSSLGEVADLIQTDPALSAEIIKYANSAFMATGFQVASVQKATVKLGMKTIVNLALGLSLLSNNKQGSCLAFNYPLFWRTCLAEAIAVRELARREKRYDSDELFVCGLLCHMGNLAFATLFPEEYSGMLGFYAGNFVPKDTEREAFGIDSAELTVELFLDWGMPAQYALGAGFHEDLGSLELGSGETARVALLIFLGHCIGLMCQSPDPQPELLKLVFDTAVDHHVDLGEFKDIFTTIVENWHEYGRLFDVPTTPCYPYNEDFA